MTQNEFEFFDNILDEVMSMANEDNTNNTTRAIRTDRREE